MNNDQLLTSKKKSLLKKIFFWFVLLIFFIVGSLFLNQIVLIGKNFIKINESKSSLFGQLPKITASQYQKLKGENDKRINILLLGLGGGDHDGSLLTDTLMIASIKFDQNNTPKVSLISIPRDLYINLKNEGNIKINNVYELAESKNKNQGGLLTSKIISDITGLSIHYYLRVDFEGFQNAVDIIGGVNVDIERSFYDPQYPTDDYGYQTITFEKGINNMNGDLALKYARSRHGIVTDNSGGYEASDFARSKRQQQIISAVKEKILSTNTITNPKKISDLLNTFGNHVRTNLELWEILRLINLAKNINSDNINSYVIDDSPNGLLYATTSSDGNFILMPKTNNFSEIQDFCQNIFDNKNTEKEEMANIEILNGTSVPNLAAQAVSRLSYNNINILDSQNAKKSDYKKSILYDFSNNSKSKTIHFIKNRFNADVIKGANLQDLRKADTKPDLILIIGENFLQLPHYEN